MSTLFFWDSFLEAGDVTEDSENSRSSTVIFFLGLTFSNDRYASQPLNAQSKKRVLIALAISNTKPELSENKAAGLGTVICLTKILAFSVQSRPSTDLTDLYTNLGINLAGIPVLSYLWRADLDKQKLLLERIQKGGSLAGLKIKLLTSTGSLTVKLSDLRRDRGIDKRVVIVVAEKESVLNSLQTSIARSLEMLQNDLVIVPLIIEPDPNNDYVLSAPTLEGLYLPEGTAGSLEDNLEHIGIPVSLAGWNNVVRKEISTALSQDANALKKGVTIIIKKNGKVGTRRFGVPLWESLVDDVAMRSELGLDIRNI
eukprot:gene31694-41139_t